MTTERRPSLHPLYTSASRLNASQPSHGLPTPVSPGPFHFDKLSSVSTPTPKAIPVSSQRFAHYRDGPRRPCDPPAPLAQHPDWHQNLQRSPTVAELDKQDKSKRPVRLRRGSSLLRLQLDAAKERDRFGLGGLTVSTSPNIDSDETPAYDDVLVKNNQPPDDNLAHDHTIFLVPHLHDHLDHPPPLDYLGTQPYPEEDSVVTMADMSKSDTTRPPTLSAPVGQSSPGNHSSKTPTPSIPVPGFPASRRQPVPPSPLSRIQSEPHASTSHRTPPHGHHPLNRGYSAIPENSPCFIHSHLDKTGSMQDWLKQKNAQPSPDNARAHPHTGTSPRSPSAHGRHVTLHNGPTPVLSSPVHGQAQHHATHQTHHRSHAPHHSYVRSPAVSPGGSRMTSPILDGALNGARVAGREGSGSGYDSDRSSQVGGSAAQDGDIVDDEEEGGSLTKQLAETAQGVREMSKELGRTRVRSRIQHVLIVTKARDNRLIKLTRELALYLMLKKPASSSDAPSRPGTAGERGMVVYVDAQLRTSKRFDAAGLQKEFPQLFEPVGRRRSSSTASLNTLHSAYPSTTSLNGDALGVNGRKKDEGQLRYWTGEMCSNSPHLFDFVVTLGGDGTVLFTSWLFQRIVPPVLPFALGSLGFLTNFDFAKYKPTMDKVIDDGIRVNLRMRFTCTVYRAIAPEEAAQASAKGKARKAIKKPGGEILMSQVDKGGWEALEGPPRSDGESEGDAVVEGRDKEIMCFSTRPVEQFEVLNDLVVDRGPSPFVSLLELFGDEHHLTTVQADGLTVSTPTGSTAYSLSAGGSLVHPQIPAILITPICPHTLSFRPMLLPDSMELRICVPYNSRSTAWASFDGRGRVELKQGDHIKVTASKYPFPTVCADKASTDWFGSISRTLRWNEREKQKSFVVVEEDNEPSKSANRPKKGLTQAESRKQAERANKELKEADEPASEEDEAEEDDEEEEDEFDIDDKSGGEDTNPSSPQNQPTVPHIPLLGRLDSSYHKPGVDSPDRFATPYAAPPPLSQRHLVEALAAAELDSKDGEVGQRDEIRSGPGEMRVEAGRGGHLIPPGRSVLVAADGSSEHPGSHRGHGTGHHAHYADHGKGDSGNANIAEQTPRPRQGRSISDLSVEVKRHSKKREEVCKAKAFAFFGQDDSASDQSDEASEC